MNEKAIRNLIKDLEVLYNEEAPNAIPSCGAVLLSYPREHDDEMCNPAEADGYFSPFGIAFLQAEDALNDPEILTTRGPSILDHVRYYEPPKQQLIKSDCVVFTFKRNSTAAWSTTKYSYNDVLEKVYGLPRFFWEMLALDQHTYQNVLDSRGYFQHCIDKLKHELYSNKIITLNQVKF